MILQKKMIGQILRSTTWLVFAIAALFLIIILWGIQFKQAKVNVLNNDDDDDDSEVIPPMQHINTALISTVQNLGMFPKEVPMLDIAKKTVSTTSEHEPEFRGAKFIADNSNKWTIQLFTVGDEELVRSFLTKQTNRKNFYYLRLQQNKNAEQFVLLYGLFSSAQQAMAETEKLQFSLPDSIKIVPEKLANYQMMVNDLGSDETTQAIKLPNVLLKSVPLPILINPMPTVTSSTAAHHQAQKNDDNGANPETVKEQDNLAQMISDLDKNKMNEKAKEMTQTKPKDALQEPKKEQKKESTESSEMNKESNKETKAPSKPNHGSSSQVADPF